MPPRVSAVIVTRGDVLLGRIIESLEKHVDEIVVWDNSVPMISVTRARHVQANVGAEISDLGVYGRYAALPECRNNIVYIQDDDCLVPAADVIAAYEPGRLVANMPESRWGDYPDSALVGWGAVFDRDLPEKAFEIAATRGEDELAGLPLGPTAGKVLSRYYPTFLRTCDVVFSALTPRTVIDVGFQHLPWAEDPARAMFKQPGHKEKRDRMLALCREARVGPDDDRRG